MGGLGCFRIYHSRSVFASGLGSCDRRHNFSVGRRRKKIAERTEMIEFLTHMPVNTVIFVTVAVLSLAAILIALTRT